MQFFYFIKRHKEIVFLFSLVTIFFHKIFLHPGEILFPAYDTRMYTAWKSFIAQSFYLFHEFPLWNPYYFGGQPFVGSGQSAMFYPINLLYLIIPPKISFGYIFFIDFLLLSIFTYIFARTIKLDKYSSLISAIMMSFSGNIVLYLLSGHIIILDGITWFPLLLIFIEKAFQKKKLIYGLFSGLTLGIIFLTGNTQIAQYAILSGFIYVALRYLAEPKLGFNKFYLAKLFLILIITICVGSLIAAIQLIPSIEFSHFSSRSDGLNFAFATDFSLHPKQLISFILPHFFGIPMDNSYWGKGNFWSLCGYAGIIGGYLAAISLIWRKNKYIIPFLGLLIFSALFALGNYSPLFPFFYKYIPTFDFFRVPARFLFIYAFSVSILSGIAMHEVQKNLKSKRFLKNLRKIFHVSLIASILTSILFVFAKMGNIGVGFLESHILKNSYAQGTSHSMLFSYISKDLFLFSIFSLAFSLFIYIVIFRKKYLPLAKIFILILIILDLFTFGNDFYSTKKESIYYTIPKELKFISNDKSKFRIFDFTGNILHQSGLSNIESLTGFDPLYLAGYRDLLWKLGKHSNTPYESFFQFYTIENYNILRLLNTKYIISQKEITSPEVSKVFDGVNKVYEVKNFLARAYFLPTSLFKKFNKHNIFGKSLVEAVMQNIGHENIKINSYQPNKIILHTRTTSSGFLILSENWFPGWNVSVNGQKSKVMKVFDYFRGVSINPGSNTIIFEYKPLTLKIGKTLSGITVIFLFILFLFLYRKRIKQYLRRRKKRKF